MYLHGTAPLPQSDLLAYKHFKASSEGGSALGLNGMGLCYWHGRIVAQDYEEAARFFERAANKRHTEALYNLAMMLKERGEPVDVVGENLLEAVRQGHLESHRELARLYAGQPTFCSLTLYLLRQYVERGDGVLWLNSAHRHYLGGRTNQSISRYLAMAVQGFEVAQSNLAFLLETGDKERAAVWWGRSSLQGNYLSRTRLGQYFAGCVRCKNGTTGDQSSCSNTYRAAAAAHCLSAALNKDPQAAYSMALLYYDGIGVPRDRKLAELFFADAVKTEPRAAFPIALTRRYLRFRRYFSWNVAYTASMLIVVWAAAFAAIMGFIEAGDRCMRLSKRRYRLRKAVRIVLGDAPPRGGGGGSEDGRSGNALNHSSINATNLELTGTSIEEANNDASLPNNRLVNETIIDTTQTEASTSAVPQPIQTDDSPRDDNIIVAQNEADNQPLPNKEQLDESDTTEDEPPFREPSVQKPSTQETPVQETFVQKPQQ